MTLYINIRKCIRQVAPPCGPPFETEAVLTSDFITLTFPLSTSKWCHGPLVSQAFFLPIFSFLRPSILGWGQARHRQITSGRKASGLWGRGTKNPK